MADPVRIAILGNSFASRMQLPALRWAGGNRVVGLAGHDAAKARGVAREWEIPLASGDWREVVALESDLVLVSTPVDLHAEMARAALERGAAVLCEKPFTMDAAEAEALLARAAGRAAWIDHELRWSPCLREVRRRVRAGSLGAPFHASIQAFLPPGRFRERPWSWWFQAERGGGILGALGSHMIDTVRWILGEVRAVRAVLATFVPERADAAGVLRRSTADEYASLHLRLASGCLVELGTSIAIPRTRAFGFEIAGHEGALRLSGADELAASADGLRFEPVAVEPPLPTDDELGMPDGGAFSRCLPLFLRDVVGALAAGRTELADAATFADGLAVQRVLDAARRSAAGDGGWIACS